MPYIKRDTVPESIGEGRTARGVAVHPDSGVWVAEVDAVERGEATILDVEYERVVAAAEAAADAPPPQVDEQAPPISRLDRLEARLADVIRLNKLVTSEPVKPMEA